jgi:hypothetical protein
MMLVLDAIDNSGQLSAHLAFQTRAKDLAALAREPATGQCSQARSNNLWMGTLLSRLDRRSACRLTSALWLSNTIFLSFSRIESNNDCSTVLHGLRRSCRLAWVAHLSLPGNQVVLVAVLSLAWVQAPAGAAPASNVAEMLRNVTGVEIT